MDVRGIAEMIMLQSIEDLWQEEQKGGSIDFFKGEGFTLCAELAGMDLYSQCRVLGMVRGIVNKKGRMPKKRKDLMRNAHVLQH